MKKVTKLLAVTAIAGCLSVAQLSAQEIKQYQTLNQVIATGNANVAQEVEAVRKFKYQKQTNAFATKRLIVKFLDNTSLVNYAASQGGKLNTMAASKDMSALQNQVIADLSNVIGHKIKIEREMFGGYHVLVLEKGAMKNPDIRRLARLLKRDGALVSAEPDIMVTINATPNDARYNEQWHYFENTAGINLPAALDVASGSGVVVAVIDTGITNHSDLNANVVGGYDFISDPAVSVDGDGRDSNPSDEGDTFQCGGM